MALTISETIVRNWERRRRRLQACKEGTTVDGVVAQERDRRFAKKLASELASSLSGQLKTRITDTITRRLAELRCATGVGSPAPQKVPDTHPVTEAAPAPRPTVSERSTESHTEAPPPAPASTQCPETPHAAHTAGAPRYGTTALEELPARVTSLENQMQRLTEELRALRKTVERSSQRASMPAPPPVAPHREPSPAAPEHTAHNAPTEERIPLGDGASMSDHPAKQYH